MKKISLSVHGLLDYLVGAWLIIMPWVTGFDNLKREQWLSMSTGLLIMLYSLCTNYEWGIYRKIGVVWHLFFDLLVGIFLVLYPWLFESGSYWPFIITGTLIVIVTCTTRVKISFVDRYRGHHLYFDVLRNRIEQKNRTPRDH